MSWLAASGMIADGEQMERFRSAGYWWLGARTYPYYGFPARYVYDGPAPIVLRSRY